MTVNRTAPHQALQTYGANRPQLTKRADDLATRARVGQTPGPDTGVPHAAIYTKGVSVVIGGQMAPQAASHSYRATNLPRFSDAREMVGRLIDIKIQ